jgi:hypothetical protein
MLSNFQKDYQLYKSTQRDHSVKVRIQNHKMFPPMATLIHCRALSTSLARNMSAATFYFTRSNSMHQDHLQTTNLCSPTVGFDEESKERGFVWRVKDQKTVIQPADGVKQKTVQVLTIRGETLTATDLR